MAYIGNQPGYGKPEVFVVTASGGETSVSTADDGRSINYAVGYVSVYLNGVLLVDGTDYTATSGSSISGLSALTSGDVVTVVSFETFAIPDAVSEQSGGAFLGDVTVPNLLVGDGGNIGSASDPDAMSIASGGDVTFSQGLRVASGAGIAFDPYGTGDPANTLDDYEEGTFTGVIADAGTGGNTGSTATGYYTKIGDVVYIRVYFPNINTSGLTSGNTLVVRGLPFTVGNNNSVLSTRLDTVAFPAGRTFVTPECINGTEYLLFASSGSVVTDTTIKVSDITSGSSDAQIAGFYKI